MGAEDAPATLLDQGFLAVHRFADPAGRVPVRKLLTIDPERKPRRARGCFVHADRGDRRQSEGDARHATIVWAVPIAFEKIRGDDPSVMARYRRKRRPLGGREAPIFESNP